MSLLSARYEVYGKSIKKAVVASQERAIHEIVSNLTKKCPLTKQLLISHLFVVTYFIFEIITKYKLPTFPFLFSDIDMRLNDYIFCFSLIGLN